MPPLRIALVDDHPIVWAGFRNLLDLEPGWAVTAALGSARDVAAWLLGGACDVMVMDLSLPDGDGLVLIRHLLVQRPGLAIVVLSMHEGALFVQDALSAGARGYVTKRAAPDELVDAIRAIGRGERYLGQDVRAHAFEAGGEAEEQRLLPELTGREAQVFLLLARGHSVSRVAATIGISNQTAYAHRANIYAKLQLQSDFQLHELAKRRGLVSAS
jgi:two-component system uhpT operon response regulator UhpA